MLIGRGSENVLIIFASFYEYQLSNEIKLMSYLGPLKVQKMPQNLQDSKFHQSFGEISCFGGLVAETDFLMCQFGV